AGGRAVGTVTFLYRHDVGMVTHRILHGQHAFLRSIRASAHAHLGEETCLEVVIMEGSPQEIQTLTDRLKAVRGVLFAKAVATSSLDVLSPRSMTPPTALYGFIASITIFPANDSAEGSASIFRYGSARRTASPNLTASTTDVAFALGPIEDTNEANVDGPRELLTAT